MTFGPAWPIDGGRSRRFRWGRTAATTVGPGRYEHDDAHRAEMREQGDEILTGPKGYKALGAFELGDRSRALDLLGFERQLLFATYSAVVVFEMADQELAYAGARAHNRRVQSTT